MFGTLTTGGAITPGYLWKEPSELLPSISLKLLRVVEEGANSANIGVRFLNIVWRPLNTF